MIRRTLSLTVLALLVASVSAWTPTKTGSSVSSFGGSVLVWADRPASDGVSSWSSPQPSLTMKKGKPNVPPQMRGMYAKQQEMAAMREQMMAASKPGADGLPVFNLYVRTKKANVSSGKEVAEKERSCFGFDVTVRNSTMLPCTCLEQMWYPCGSFKGDDRSAALAKNYANDGLLAGISKKQIDAGIAGSLFRDQDKLADSICRGYPQLRKSRDEFEYGYKLAFNGLSDEKANEIKVIEPKEQKGVLDGIKTIFS